MTAYSGSATGADSATLPTHATGDLILIYAFRDSNDTSITLPAGYTSIADGGTGNSSHRIGYKIATSAAETSGTWTNSQDLIAVVYTSAGTLGIGSAFSQRLNEFSALVYYDTFTLDVTDGTSWVVGANGNRGSAADTSIAPASMTNRAQHLNGTASESGLHDTNGGVTAWATETASVGGAANGWKSVCIEITEVLSGVTITDVDTDEIITNGQTGIVITGTGFEATQSTGTVTIDGVTQTIEASWADTSIPITHVLGVMKFGAQTLTVTNASAGSANQAITVNPAAGYSYVTLTSVGSSDITAVAPLIANDQLEYENTTTPSGLPVSVSAGGVITITGDPAGESFDVRAWDSVSPSWGAYASQSGLAAAVNYTLNVSRGLISSLT